MTGPTIGYIGLDHHHCEPYLETIAETPGTVTCACEPDLAFDASTVDGLGDVPVYRTPEALFEAEDVDVAWITRSNRDTPETILTAIEHGVDVFTEKPAARTAADLDPVIDAAGRSDATVCVAYTWRSHPLVCELRERVEAGFFGDVRSFETRYLASDLRHRDTDHYLFDRAASRGGILQWLGVHWLDALPWVLEDPIAGVSASTTMNDDVGIEDTATLQYRTESGVIGTLRTGYALGADCYDTYIGVAGTDATCAWDPTGEGVGFEGETALELHDVEGDRTDSPREIVYDDEPTPGYCGEWGLTFAEAFFEARTSDTEPPATLRDARRVLRVLDTAYEAAATDRWVGVDDADSSAVADLAPVSGLDR